MSPTKACLERGVCLLNGYDSYDLSAFAPWASAPGDCLRSITARSLLQGLLLLAPPDRARGKGCPLLEGVISRLLKAHHRRMLSPAFLLLLAYGLPNIFARYAPGLLLHRRFCGQGFCCVHGCCRVEL